MDQEQLSKETAVSEWVPMPPGQVLRGGGLCEMRGFRRHDVAVLVRCRRRRRRRPAFL